MLVSALMGKEDQGYVLRTSVCKHLHRKVAYEGRCEMDEIDIAWWFASPRRADITHHDDEYEIGYIACMSWEVWFLVVTHRRQKGQHNLYV